MSERTFQIGDQIRLQFVWRIPNGDFLRALFEADVVHFDQLSQKYVVRLIDFAAGRQEDGEGRLRPLTDVDRSYWALVDGLKGRRISLSSEAAGGSALRLRLDTLTGEHNFFTRLDELPQVLDRVGGLASPNVSDLPEICGATDSSERDAGGRADS